MNISKELVIKALAGKDPFVEHDGELYKKYDRIEIKANIGYRDKRVGVFKTEPEEFFDGFLISFFYDGELVMQRVVGSPSISIERNGDKLDLDGLGGLIYVEVTAS